MQWPASVAEFTELACERCGGDVLLRWRSETTPSSGLLPLVEGAGAALGASFEESYGVWYILCARATIWNAAFERGAVATVVTYACEAKASPMDVALRGLPTDFDMPASVVEPTIDEMSEEFVTEAMHELGAGCLEELSQEMM